LVLSL